DSSARCPQWTNADPGARHVSLDYGRIIRRRAARYDRHAGHLVSVRHRRVADAVCLRDCHPTPGLLDRTNLAFKRERIDRRWGDVAQLISRYRGARSPRWALRRLLRRRFDAPHRPPTSRSSPYFIVPLILYCPPNLIMFGMTQLELGLFRRQVDG